MISSKNLEITGSRHLINWLQTQQISLATLSERHSFKPLWQPPDRDSEYLAQLALADFALYTFLLCIF
jgi:hypothetical protein